MEGESRFFLKGHYQTESFGGTIYNSRSNYMRVFGGLLTINYFSCGFLAGDTETRRQIPHSSLPADR
jgi:hypothetical protein